MNLADIENGNLHGHCMDQLTPRNSRLVENCKVSVLYCMTIWSQNKPISKQVFRWGAKLWREIFSCSVESTIGWKVHTLPHPPCRRFMVCISHREYLGEIQYGAPSAVRLKHTANHGQKSVSKARVIQMLHRNKCQCILASPLAAPVYWINRISFELIGPLDTFTNWTSVAQRVCDMLFNMPIHVKITLPMTKTDAKPPYFRGRLPIFVNIFVHFDNQIWQPPYFERYDVNCHYIK